MKVEMNGDKAMQRVRKCKHCGAVVVSLPHRYTGKLITTEYISLLNVDMRNIDDGVTVKFDRRRRHKEHECGK